MTPVHPTIVIVGGGTAGLSLAVAAAERGLTVTIVEKAPVLGGTLDRSYASTSAAGTRQQAAHGIKDDPATHFAEVMRIAGDKADPVVTQLWIDHAAETIAWLESLGVVFRFPTSVYHGPGAHDPYSTPRVQHVIGRGPALAEVLIREVQRYSTLGRITICVSTTVVGLMRDNKRTVTGVLTESSSRGDELIVAKSVVITSGGCLANPRLYSDLHGASVALDIGYPFCTGDGLLLGQSAGGKVTGGDAYCPLIGCVMSDTTLPSIPARGDFFQSSLNAAARDRPPWEIWVNSAGARFVREDAEHPQEKELALRCQAGQRLWIIHDQTMMDTYPPPITGWDKTAYRLAFGTLTMCQKAPSLSALAIRAGIDPKGLTETLRVYNRALTRGDQDPLGREHRPLPIATPPFYAVQVQGYTLATFAGLLVDGALRVLDSNERPIPGLYAAGEVLGATAVGSSGFATGSLVTPALTLGRLLGSRILPA